MDKQKKCSIIHLDLDAFFASVEQRDHRAYRGKPLIVGGILQKNGKLSRRGVVCAASYQARQYGIHAGMPIWEAQQKCPKATFTPARISHYRRASQQFFHICSHYTPFMEPLSIDEVFLDVASCEYLFGPPGVIAQTIKDRVKKELALPVSVGIASNKFLAKIATRLGKPNGFYILPTHRVRDVLYPLPIKSLWGIGHKTAQRLNRSGIFSIRQLAHMPDAILQEILGKNGPKIKQLAQGIDPNPVCPPDEAKSIGKESTFAENITDKQQLNKVALCFSQSIGYSARKRGYVGKTITLKIRFYNFKTIQKSITLQQATNLDDIIFQKARELLKPLKIEAPGVRLLGIKLSSLIRGQRYQQLDLYQNENLEEKWEALIQSVDRIREKHGTYMIERAALLDHQLFDLKNKGVI